MFLIKNILETKNLQYSIKVNNRWIKNSTNAQQRI